MRILVTGASSLVGFSILESLEGRRAGLEVIGISSDADNSEARRYDHHRVVPQSDDPDFPDALAEQVDQWQPDLVMPGRDPDIAHLAHLRQTRPDLAPRIVTGNPQTAMITLDKALTAQFAVTHDLVWVDTLVCGTEAELAGFAHTHPLPWIAKPRSGSGSHGVFLLTEPGHADHWARVAGMVIQPLLGPPRIVEAPRTDVGIPWFTDVGDPWLRSVQTVVLPNGDLSSSFCSDHTLRGGITQTSTAAEDPLAVQRARAWASALSEAGWRGSLNIQMKVDPTLGPVPFEINGRLSGATHGRLLLGFDELAIVIQGWTGVRLPTAHSGMGTAYYRPAAWLG
jgi:carbamoyl-phosphate synthase large subunit